MAPCYDASCKHQQSRLSRRLNVLPSEVHHPLVAESEPLAPKRP